MLCKTQMSPDPSLQEEPWPNAQKTETRIDVPRKVEGPGQVLTMPHCPATPLRICPGKVLLRLGWVHGDLTYHGECEWCGHLMGLRPSDSLLVIYMQQRSPEAFTMDALVTHYYGADRCEACRDARNTTMLCMPDPDTSEHSSSD